MTTAAASSIGDRGEVNATYSREIELLLCCRGDWDGTSSDRMRRLLEEGVDGEVLSSRARRTGAERMALLGLLLAHELYGSPIRGDMIQKARSTPTVRDLVSEMKEDLSAEEMDSERDGSSNLKYDLFHYRLGDTFESRVRYLFYRITTPSHPKYWSYVSVGDHWIALHAFVRPFRVLLKSISLLGSGALSVYRNGLGANAR